MAYLVLQLKDFEVKSYEIDKKVFRIGRKPENDLSLSDPFVSRNHAEIVVLEDGCFELRDGDKLTMGQFLLIFKLESPCASTGVEMLAAEDMDEMLEEIMTAALKTLKAERGSVSVPWAGSCHTSPRQAISSLSRM